MGVQEQRLEAIRQIILKHKGKANVLPANEIGKQLDIPENDTVPTTRHLILKLILDEGMPIAATRKGYFLIETEKELAEYMEYLQQRIDQTTTRMRTVFSNYEMQYGRTKRKTLDEF